MKRIALILLFLTLLASTPVLAYERIQSDCSTSITRGHWCLSTATGKTYVGNGVTAIEVSPWCTSGTYIWDCPLTSNLGIGINVPTAYLHIKAGTAAAGTAPIKLTAGPLNTVPEQGTIEYDGSRLYMTNVTTRRIISRASDSIITPTTVANTTVETTVFSANLSANVLEAHKVYRIYALGQMSTANASDTLTMRTKIAGVTVATMTSTAGSVTDVATDMWSIFTVRTSGVSGTIASHGRMILGSKEAYTNVGSTVIDTTISNTIQVTVQWSAAAAGNTITIDQGFMEAMD